MERKNQIKNLKKIIVAIYKVLKKKLKKKDCSVKNIIVTRIIGI